MLIGYGGAFLGGMAAILSPCAVLLLPAFFAYAFGDDRARLLGRTGLFYLGLLLALIVLVLSAQGILGRIISWVVYPAQGLLLAPIRAIWG